MSQLNEREKRYRGILEREKLLIQYSASGFVTCTELSMNVDDWLEYSHWKDAQGIHIIGKSDDVRE